jgi:hypothetical protein
MGTAVTPKQQITVSRYNPNRRGVALRIDVAFTVQSENGVEDVLQALWQARTPAERNDRGTWPPMVTDQPRVDAYAGVVMATSELGRALERANAAGMDEIEIAQLTAEVRRRLNEVAG